jgi:hypothetical protein
VELGRVAVAVAARVGAADLSFGDRSGEAVSERRELVEDLVEALVVLERDRLLLVGGLGLGVVVGHWEGSIRVLVLNVCVEREPLYGIAQWAARFDPVALSLAGDEVALLCDDRVGRALDRLFDADRASMLTQLALCAINEFDCSQLHNDSTSITLYGDYPAGRRA